MRRLIVSLAIVFVPLSAFAWGEKGHLISSEAATFGLPNDMPIFFYKAYPELIYLGPDPDRWRGGGESIEGVNPPDHFLDYEYVAQLDLPPSRYRFLTLLADSGTLRRRGIYLDTAGFLPWRIAELSELLTTEFRLWRLSAPRSTERAAIEHEIIDVAGVLGHYAADASNPLHTTINYNGWILPNPSRFAIDCETHERFETQFVSRALDRDDVVRLLDPPKLRTKYFADAVEFIRASNALVEPLYRIDRDGGFDIFRPVSPQAKEFTAHRLAAGASLLRDLWWSAWRNSATPPTRRRRLTPAPNQAPPSS